MPRIGASFLTWTNVWNDESGVSVIRAAAAAGLDFIELPITDPDNFNAELFRKELDAAGIEVITGGALPPWAHAPDEPAAARKVLRRVIDKTAAVGATLLGGVWYGSIGVVSGQAPTERERATCAEVLADAAAHAADLGVSIALEPVNRYEGHLFNTIGDVLTLIEVTAAPNLLVSPDTYHMNIEEASVHDSLVAATGRLGSVQMSDNDRGAPGHGSIDFDEVFRGLAEASFTGYVYLESFAVVNPNFPPASYWRRPSWTSEAILADFVPFVREKAAQAGLA